MKKTDYKEKFERIKSNAYAVFGKKLRDQIVLKKLYRNIVDEEDILNTLQPYGNRVIKNLPSDFIHEDILKPKIDSIINIDINKSLNYKVVQVNKEAGTEFERAYIEKIKQALVPLLTSDTEPTDEDITETMKSVKVSMERDYKTVPERAMEQLLEFAKNKYKLSWNMHKVVEDLVTTGEGVFYVGFDGEVPTFKRVRSTGFASDKSEGHIHEANWQFMRYYMHYTEVLNKFDVPSNVKNEIIPKNGYTNTMDAPMPELLIQGFEDDPELDSMSLSDTVIVEHAVWKQPRKIYVLRYLDAISGEVRRMIVDESYKLNPDIGDIEIKEKYVEDIHEAWVVNGKHLIKYGPVIGQLRDVNNIDKAEMPYRGYKIPVTTSPLYRGKIYQYLYDVFTYRLRQLISSDKGRKIAISYGIIPDKMEEEEWVAAFNTNSLLFYDASKMSYQDVNTLIKEIDLSLVSDLKKYIDLRKEIREILGIAIGVPEGMEGNLSPYMSAQNVQTMITMSTNVLEVLFFGLNESKKNIFNAIVEVLRMSASVSDSIELMFVTDDMSRAFLRFDPDMFANATFGIFIKDTTNDERVRVNLPNIIHAAMQNQTVDMWQAIEMLREKDMDVIVEMLRNAEAEKSKREADMVRMKQQMEQQAFDRQVQMEQVKHKAKLEEIVTKGEIDMKRDIVKAGMLGQSFNPDVDENNNSINDFYELTMKELKNMKKDLSLLRRELKLDKKEVELRKKELNTKK